MVRLRSPAVVLASLACVAVTSCALLVDTGGLASSSADDELDAAAAADAAPTSASGDATTNDGARAWPPGTATFPSNGHGYLVVVAGTLTWDVARTEAEKLGGHLATIGSAEENAFVWSLVRTTPGAFAQSTLGPWLGGRQSPEGVEPDGGWGWITGEPWSFTAWVPGAPNEDRPGEDYLAVFGSLSAETMTWADLPVSNVSSQAYVVEFE